MIPHRKNIQRLKPVWLIFAIGLFSFACNLPKMQTASAPSEIPPLADLVDIAPTAAFSVTPAAPIQLPSSTPVLVPEPEVYHMNDLASYMVQPGDTLPALAARFRTTTGAITDENPSNPQLAGMTTLLPGQQVLIRLVVEPDWEPQTRVIPDSLFVNGPGQVGFDTQAYLNTTTGWLSRYVDRNGPKDMTGAQIVDNVAQNYSISPRLILALLEYQLGALTNPALPGSFFLGSWDAHRSTLPRQLSWAGNILNNGYYGWRAGALVEFTAYGGQRMAPSPWQNAASAALQYYFSRFSTADETATAISPAGVAQTYMTMFGAIDWESSLSNPFIPGDLQQPLLSLPFPPGLKWAFTAGPHSGWGTGQPWAAIDFAPPSTVAGCDASPHWASAMADGLVVRSDSGVVLLDLDGDGDTRTGWVVFYLHIDPIGAVKAGTWISKGGLIGHPSCVGGQSTGRNMHIARLFNGEWIPAGGVLPFNMDGWVVVQGEAEYQGYLARDAQLVYPSSLGEGTSNIAADAVP